MSLSRLASIQGFNMLKSAVWTSRPPSRACKPSWFAARWERQCAFIVWQVSVPPNTTAKLRLPSATQGMAAAAGDEVRFIREADGRRLYSVSSGAHGFSLKPLNNNGSLIKGQLHQSFLNAEPGRPDAR